MLLRRIGAYLTDIVLLFAILAPLGYVVMQALGIEPSSPREVYATLLLNFSLPVWAYFTVSDHSPRGATLGKRLLSVQTSALDNSRVGWLQALGRTAVKMLPWEMAHAASFLFVPALGEFGVVSWIGLGTSYALTFAYVVAAWRTGGHRSVHDWASGTQVVRV
ncbi:MAG: RDD family protein [Bacteroidota bacterium]